MTNFISRAEAVHAIELKQYGPTELPEEWVNEELLEVFDLDNGTTRVSVEVEPGVMEQADPGQWIVRYDDSKFLEVFDQDDFARHFEPKVDTEIRFGENPISRSTLMEFPRLLGHDGNFVFTIHGDPQKVVVTEWANEHGNRVMVDNMPVLVEWRYEVKDG